MNTRLCLKIAGRIDAGLQRELGEGIDLARMLADPTYTRDVLLVCDAFGDGDLRTLAQDFRAAATAQGADASAGSHEGEPSGFSPSRFFNSLFGSNLGSGPPAHGEHGSASKARQRGGFLRRGR